MLELCFGLQVYLCDVSVTVLFLFYLVVELLFAATTGSSHPLSLHTVVLYVVYWYDG